jgi:hypothetical protein
MTAMVRFLANVMIFKSRFSATTWDKMTEIEAVSHVG